MYCNTCTHVHTHTYYVHSKGPDSIVGQDLCVDDGDGQVPETDATSLRPVLVTLGLQTGTEKNISSQQQRLACDNVHNPC